MHWQYLTPKKKNLAKSSIAAQTQLRQLFKTIVRSKIKEKEEPEWYMLRIGTKHETKLQSHSKPQKQLKPFKHATSHLHL
jgi:hypothetical protein